MLVFEDSEILMVSVFLHQKEKLRILTIKLWIEQINEQRKYAFYSNVKNNTKNTLESFLLG